MNYLFTSLLLVLSTACVLSKPLESSAEYLENLFEKRDNEENDLPGLDLETEKRSEDNEEDELPGLDLDTAKRTEETNEDDDEDDTSSTNTIDKRAYSKQRVCFRNLYRKVCMVVRGKRECKLRRLRCFTIGYYF